MGKIDSAKNAFESAIYIIACVFSLGFVYLFKIIIKKAVMEADDY